eukprot:CAMPEP_0181415454 /NCGR_PEP_ID=MMETSP1110-20121109/10026_1 /TAXON_ID=174948 /ORGANISM="Symbiodinium sp., Strain CCMP421" /LENGTH=63 /DNA_ID=CAMNT_0023538359 /DNA_START=146 /DNA_END=333 /DNA_ORIENTATION=+
MPTSLDEMRSRLCATCSGKVMTVANAFARAPMKKASSAEISAVFTCSAFRKSYAKNWMTGLAT